MTSEELRAHVQELRQMAGSPQSLSKKLREGNEGKAREKDGDSGSIPDDMAEFLGGTGAIAASATKSKKKPSTPKSSEMPADYNF